MKTSIGKIVLTILIITLVAGRGIFIIPSAKAAGVNLITNPSLEIDADGNNIPDGWSTDQWGANTATFTYPVPGIDGASAAKVDITAYTDGDAKWYFTDVPVTAGQKYNFTDKYLSTANTLVVAQYLTTTGVYAYQELTDLPASGVWQSTEATFTVPANVTAVTIFHVLVAVGSLTVDAYALSAVSTPDPNNLILNPSLEDDTNSNQIPDYWSTDQWGTNTATFTYPVPGVDGASAAKVDITAYTDGDAKWYFNPLSVTSGQTYAFSDQYLSSTNSMLVAQFTMSDGSFVYQDLIDLPLASTWQATQISFIPPTGAQSVTIFHLIASVGSLTIDNAKLINTGNLPTDPNNLIYNPSVETDSNFDGLPDYWTKNGWGTNTAVFTYPVPGSDGIAAAKIDITAYTNGDAKWYFNPLSVTPGQKYSFRDYYIATVPTELVASYTVAGNASYQYLASLPVAANWQIATVSFTAPSGVTAMTIFHVINQIGSLTIDDTKLVVDPLSQNSDLIPNGSLEIVSPVNNNLPAGWQTAGWGTSTTAFEYGNIGPDGSKAVKLTVSNYQSGDAKWMYPAQAIPADKDYRFTVWYRTNTVPKVVAMLVYPDNSIAYAGLPNPEPAGSDWQKYQSEISIPMGVAQASIFMLLNNNGWLETDNYSLVPYQYVGLARPLVTLTFDDGFEGNVNTILPVLNQYGFKTTQFYATQYIEGLPEQIANVQTFSLAGHEVGSHTVTHPFLTQLTPEALDYELAHAQSFLQSITGQLVADFASPYGDYNELVNAKIKQYYSGAHRTVDDGYNSKDNFDPYRLRVHNMLVNTSLTQFQSWVNKAINDKTWLILVYHKVDTTDLGPYDTLKSDFDAQMAWLANAGITVARMDDALVEIKAQL